MVLTDLVWLVQKEGVPIWEALISLRAGHGSLHLPKNICYLPCWFSRESITTGNMLLFSWGLKQMEGRLQESGELDCFEQILEVGSGRGWSLGAGSRG